MVVDRAGNPALGCHSAGDRAGTYPPDNRYGSCSGIGRGRDGGWEPVSRGWDESGKPEVRVAIDEKDQLWVAYRSGALNSVVVAHRLATAAPGAWSYQELPPTTFGTALGVSNVEDLRSSGDGVLDLLARPGGGAWVGFSVNGFLNSKPEASARGAGSGAP